MYDVSGLNPLSSTHLKFSPESHDCKCSRSLEITVCLICWVGEGEFEKGGRKDRGHVERKWVKQERGG